MLSNPLPKLRQSSEEITKCVEILNNGGIIIYPTDTIWGIGCDATNDDTIKKLKSLKGRNSEKAFIILVDADMKIQRYVKEMPEVAWDLLDTADKPLTIIYPDAKGISSEVTPEDGSIGIRVVKEGFCNKLLQRFKKPIVSTSINLSGQPPISSLDSIPPPILAQVDHIVQGEPFTNSSRPSSVIKLDAKGHFEILRK